MCRVDTVREVSASRPLNRWSYNMRSVVKCLIGGVGLVLGWFAVWSYMLAGDVARVKASIHYQDMQFKTSNRYVTFRADDVVAAGFPFHFRVKVERPTLSMIFRDETFAASTETMLLEPTDATQGRYRVTFPTRIEAVYAVNGTAPETYTVAVAPMPDLALRAQGHSGVCGGFPLGGQPCAAVAADAPIISYALGLPPSLVATVTLNGESRDVGFTLIPVAVPVFQAIPTAIDRPLELFVGTLREAMVFKTPGNEVMKP